MLPVLDQASFLPWGYLVLRLKGRTGDSRACARCLQFGDSRDQAWWRRKSDCRERDVDIHGVGSLAKEVVHGIHHALVLDVVIVDVVHRGVKIWVVHDERHGLADKADCASQTQATRLLSSVSWIVKICDH
jgi:hypothetical protein